eukprot:TRINITY_DN4669_c0_g1_i3.p1 TRINITY_DN4669_c0_g1~~TRINITY_DN4669_c0_g1_i3.p1  ORF type:complete len:104 (+),score=7.25 TRINITY_DN4669_c0_g1_i3:281-592(+)
MKMGSFFLQIPAEPRDVGRKPSVAPSETLSFRSHCLRSDTRSMDRSQTPSIMNKSERSQPRSDTTTFLVARQNQVMCCDPPKHKHINPHNQINPHNHKKKLQR